MYIAAAVSLAGQEKFHALGPIYYRNADGALLVYDITDQDTFARVQVWIKELRKVVGPNIKITIAGNKFDLQKQRQVSEETALEYAKKVGASHFYTSAKANKNVEEAFMDLAKSILQKKLENRIGGSGSGGDATSPAPQDKIIRFDSFSKDPQVDSRISGSGNGGLRVVQDNDNANQKPASGSPCGCG